MKKYINMAIVISILFWGFVMDFEKSLNNIWELYGLKENPFSTSPLLVKGGTIPIDSFVGRIEELKRISRLFGSRGGSRILVYGDVGLGKTTFVNVARYNATKAGFFTPFKEIATQSDWDANSFILNTLSAIYSSIKIVEKKIIDDKIFKKLESVVDFGVIDKSFGIDVAGFGGNYSQTIRNPQVISQYTLQTFFQELVDEIAMKTEKDIIIHYNNLELIPEKKLRTIFENLGDFFQTKNVHFIFVGNLTTHSIIQSMPRLSSIMSDTPIVINELSLKEIEEIISARLKYLRIKDLTYIVPYKKEVLKVLYDLYGGNIRNILNSLSTAVGEITTEKPIIINENDLAIILNSILEKRYLADIQPKAKVVLLEAVKHPEVTNKTLSKNTKIARSNVSTYVSQLQSSGCIYLRRKDGKDKYWAVEPRVKWALLKPKQNDLNQKSLIS